MERVDGWMKDGSRGEESEQQTNNRTAAVVDLPKIKKKNPNSSTPPS